MHKDPCSYGGDFRVEIMGQTLINFASLPDIVKRT